MTLFVTAFHEETQSVLKFFKDARREDKRLHVCEMNKSRLACLEVGIGLQNAKYSLEKFFEHAPEEIKKIFVVGFCGALDPALEVGQIVMPREIQNEKGEGFIALTNPKYETMSFVNKILSVEKVVRTTRQKKELFKKTSCQIVDMESAALAEVAQRYRLQISVIKSVLDESSQEIPQKNILIELKNNLKIAKERLEKDFLEKFICPF